MLALVLAMALTISMMVLPATAATDSSPFQDITDPTTAEAAEVLRLLDIVNGTGDGTYAPTKSLTRGEFCKIVIEMMGLGDQEPAQRSRTIFLDVGSTHWARGYINLASTIVLGDGDSATRLMMGLGDGTFAPDRQITYGEGVTILMRVLGYGDGDVVSGVYWYDGYMALANQAGLTEGLSLSGGDSLNRGQAAILFYNLLFTKSKGGSEQYLATLGGQEMDSGILLDVEATSADGTALAIETTTGTYKTQRTDFSTDLEGMQGSFLLDDAGWVIAFAPKESVEYKSVTVSTWNYNQVIDSNNNTIAINPDATIYMDGKESTYQAVYLDLKSGLPLTIYYTLSGQVDYLFLRTTQLATDAIVAKNALSGTTNPFSKLVTGNSNYKIMKGGLPATVADIRQYDVATFDANTNTLNISDLRLTGIYENVYPSPSTPATITVMGASFTVLSSAAVDLQSFELGDQITLLLTADGQVGGVVDSTVAKSTTVGVVTAIDSSGAATVTPLNSILPEFSGTSTYTGSSTSKVEGQLVTISSSALGRISLSRLTSSGAKGNLDVASGTMGEITLASNVVIYETVGNGVPYPVAWSDITCNTVQKADILYMSTDYADRINILVLDDVTGDGYIYGVPTYVAAVAGTGNMDAGTNATITITNGSASMGPLTCGMKFDKNTYYGIAPSQTVDAGSGNFKIADYITLTQVQGVSTSAIDVQDCTIETNTMILPIAKDVQCYNSITKTWFTTDEVQGMDGVNLARAFSDTITIYYDKAPEVGGKVRLIVVE